MNIKLLLSFFLVSYVVTSQHITIYPEVDTYVLSSSADDSFGTETELLLKHTLTQNNERTVWINFSTEDVTIVPEQVLLKLTQNSGDDSNISIVGVDNDFDNSLTWNSTSENEYYFDFGGMRDGDVSYIDVTSYVLENLNSEVSFKLFTTGLVSSTIKLASNEDTTDANKPQLLVYYEKQYDIPTYNNFFSTAIDTEYGIFEGNLLMDQDHIDDFSSTYGGWENYTSTASGFFRVEQDCNNVWHFVDPEGYGFYSVGLNTITENEVMTLPDDVQAYYFNTMGSWSDETITGLAYTPRFNVLNNFKQTSDEIKSMYNDLGILPVFEESFESYVQDLLETELTPYLNDERVLGYFLDNELLFHKYQLSLSLENLATDNAQYIAAETWMIAKYGTGYSIDDITEADENEYIGYVAETYFSTVSAIFKSIDPNHLLIGTRVHAAGKYIPELFAAMSEHLDVISINFYNRFQVEEEYWDMWMEYGQSPFIITEFYTKAEDTGYSNADGAGWLVATQTDRANWFENFMMKLLKSPANIGYHWFRFVDKESDDSNKGAFDLNYEPWEELINAMTNVNQSIYSLRSHVLFGNSNYNGCVDVDYTYVHSCDDAYYDGFEKIEAEDFCAMYGVTTTNDSRIGGFHNGDWLRYANVDFDALNPVYGEVLASRTSTYEGEIEIRLDSVTGTLLGSVTSVETTSDSDFATLGFDITEIIDGVHDIYLVGSSEYSYKLANIDSFIFYDQETLSVKEYDLDFLPIDIYPNPFIDKINVSVDNEFSIQVFDFLGNQVYSNDSESSKSIDLSFLTSGIYFIEVTTNNNHLIKKLIKN